MNWILILFFTGVLIFLIINSRRKGGEIIRIRFNSVSLTGNGMNEPPVRNVSIYLPEDYETSGRNYPCVYFLHGFGGNDEIIHSLEIKELFDKAIRKKIIPPLILIFPDSKTKFNGSFYTNSDYAGNWADYIAKDLVTYIDSHYRTIRDRESRGIAGHSMGGNGALKLSMLYPQVFSSVYALSPSILYWDEELVPEHPAFLKIQQAQKLEDVVYDLYPIGFLAMGSTYSANPDKPPFFCDMPVYYENGKMKLDSAVFNIWEKEFPLKIAERSVDKLKMLKGIAFDWGDSDEFAHIPPTCRKLSATLKSAGIEHFAESYSGNHENRIGTFNGRIYRKLIPFFSDKLKFQVD